MKDRILAIRKDAGLTREEFSGRLGVTANYIYMMESGLREPSPAIVREICRQFSVNERWLSSGEGQMHRDLSPAMEAADKVRRILVDAPGSTAAAVLSSLLALDPLGPEWETIGTLLLQMSSKMQRSQEA